MIVNRTLEKLRSRHLYEFAEIVHANVLGVGDFSDDVFPDLFPGIERFSKPYRDTLLHEVIRGILAFYMDYWTGHIPDEVDMYKSILTESDIKIPNWLSAKDVHNNIGKLDRLLLKAVDIITPSIFFILFSDRQFLASFGQRVAQHVGSLRLEDYPELLVGDGHLKRPAYLPTWLKAGIFYRDKGHCQACFKDMTGLSRPLNDLHLDHITPLAQSGSNDPTNFQILCNQCNLTKGKKPINQPPKFYAYW